jgi:hypothetical protein
MEHVGNAEAVHGLGQFEQGLLLPLSWRVSCRARDTIQPLRRGRTADPSPMVLAAARSLAGSKQVQIHAIAVGRRVVRLRVVAVALLLLMTP